MNLRWSARISQNAFPERLLSTAPPQGSCQSLPSARASDAEAFVVGEATLLLNETDPFCWGIR